MNSGNSNLNIYVGTRSGNILLIRRQAIINIPTTININVPIPNITINKGNSYSNGYQNSISNKVSTTNNNTSITSNNNSKNINNDNIQIISKQLYANRSSN